VTGTVMRIVVMSVMGSSMVTLPFGARVRRRDVRKSKRRAAR
jgi:hypothetical protein